MADITDPRAIRFVNEQLRPLAEQLRALKALSAAALVDWYAGIDALVPNDASPVADGREAEGVSRLTGTDVHNIVYLLATAVAPMVDSVIAKSCVRPLRLV